MLLDAKKQDEKIKETLDLIYEGKLEVTKKHIEKVLNICFDTNYFFSQAIPPFIIELLPFLKYFPVVIILEVMEIIIMGGLYLFFKKQDGLLKS